MNEDALVDDVPDRPISPHPNYVTVEGLAQIEAAVAHAQEAYGRVQANQDREALAKAGRELRYWTSRRSSARVLEPNRDSRTVQFGSTITFARDDGCTQKFRIVGEDEANPANGSISHVSPLAKALLGRTEGDVVKAGTREAEILKVE